MRVNCSYSELRELEKIVPNPKNPNTHPDTQIELLAKIIEAQGWRSPIVISARSGYIVKGHGRLLAARKLGYEKAPIDIQNYENEAEEYADLIADNRIAELANIDNSMLAEIITQLEEEEGFDLDLTGLDELARDTVLKSIDIDSVFNGISEAFESSAIDNGREVAKEITFTYPESDYDIVRRYIDKHSKKELGNQLLELCKAAVKDNVNEPEE